MGLTAVVRGVGHRKGGKQLLNTSGGLVRTVVRNELIVARCGAVVWSFGVL